MKIAQKEKLERLLSTIGERNILLVLIKYGREEFDNSIEFIDFLTEALATNPIIKQKFIERLHPIFRNISMQKFLTDFGMFSEDGLISQFFRQVGKKLLPQISDDQTLLSLINDVLYSRTNYNYVKLIPIDRWVRFFEVLFNSEILICNKEYVKKQIRTASTILMDRIVGGATDVEMLKLSYIKNIEESPFQKLSKNLVYCFEGQSINDEKLTELEFQIKKCNVFLDNIINQKEKKGLSLKITIKVTRLRQQLKRLLALIRILNLLDSKPLHYSMAHLIKSWLNFYSPKNSVSNSFQSTLYVVTFLITWHNGQTGEKYITTNSKEYLKMLYSAAGGGVIVAVLCFIKIQMALTNHTPFSQAVLYSLNYAWGFVVIYLLHWTLATKQPAMTAAALAHTLNQEETTENDYGEFARLFARLFRSQFIAFIGNVGAVMPVAILIYFLLSHFTGFELINEYKALCFRDELVNLNGNIFYFGAIAGIFLFMSGMVSGLTENYNRYNNIPERIYNHPLFKKFAKEKTRRNFSIWYEKKMGGIVGNVFFGFCLGSAFLIGNFIGIPFDIRHITFSAGNYAIALCYFNFDITWLIFLKGMVGIMGIGIFNFLVSFSLSLWVAMKSINIPTREIGKILYPALKLFIKNPLRFFFPINWK